MHQVRMCLFPVFQPREHIDNPCAAPARMSTAIRQPAQQCRCCSFRQLWRAMRADLRTRMQRKQLRNMSMSGVSFLVIFEPFHDLSVLTDLSLRQTLQHLAKPFPVFGINAKQANTLQASPYQLPNNLCIHGRTHAKRPASSIS
ncbi:hypothetical protein D3C73_733190 [compost metagenome]